MIKRIALYARVSTGGQTVENQLRELQAWAASAGHEIAGIYVDRGISGTKGRDKRPEFDRLLKDATRRRFDMVAAWSVDRLGRSLQDLVAFLRELHAARVGLFLHQQALDTSTPAGEAMFGMLGVFGQFEAGMIRERVNAGLARAKAAGRLGGRPKSRREAEIAQALAAGGRGIKKIAADLGVGVSVVQRVKRAIEATAPTAAPPSP